MKNINVIKKGGVLTILESEQGNRHTYVETTRPEIDTGALNKLLQSKPPLDFKEHLQRVIIRCDRTSGLWYECTSQGRPLKTHVCAVILDAKLYSLVDAYGCEPGFTGLVEGLKLSEERPVAVPTDMIRHLFFNPANGTFHDAHTGGVVKKADYVILKTDCTHDYISGSMDE